MKYPSLLLAFLTYFFIACSKDSDDNAFKNLPQNQVEIKIKPSIKNQISFYVVAGEITVDWGDGSTDLCTAKSGKEITHQYENQEYRTIKLQTQDLSYFFKSSFNSHGEILELHFGKCSQLRSIKCDTSLQSLDVHKLENLKLIDIVDNLLFTTDKLNKLFATLPLWKGETENAPIIKVNRRLKYTSSIATNRGWKVESILNVRPENRVKEDSVYTSESGFLNAFNGILLRTSNYLKNYYLFEALYSHTLTEADISKEYPNSVYLDIYLHDVYSDLCKRYLEKL